MFRSNRPVTIACKELRAGRTVVKIGLSIKHYRKKMSAIREPRNSKGITKTRLIHKLIRLYHANECLWNPKSPGYHNLALKDNAWQCISMFFKDDHLTTEQLQLMIISLRYYYERERLAIMTNKLNGVCYTPRHSYYDKLHFLSLESEPLNILKVFVF